MLKQVGRQIQHFNVLPQQIQLLKLFHLTELDLQHRIQVELNDNPLLEAEIQDDAPTEDSTEERSDADDYSEDDVPDYNLEHNNYLPPDHTQRPFAEAYDFRRALKPQLNIQLTTDQDIAIAEFLIDSLDEDGLLDRDISALADDLSFQHQCVVEPMHIANVLAALQHIEPCGMGCRTMKDFLLFQLQRMPKTTVTENSIRLLTEHYHDLSHRQMEKIAVLMQIPESELREVIQFIGTLPKKPFSESQSSAPAAQVIPDFMITEVDDRLEVSLFRQRSSVVFVNQSLGAMLAKQNKADKATVTYLKSKLNSAQWFVDAIKQRETTMMSIMTALVRYQSAYFKEGDVRFLVPMILKNIADIVHMDISTISRITCNKYVDTPFGIISLKSLFSEGVENAEGENISNRVIQQAIQEAVNVEDSASPYTDRELVSLLSSKGLSIARRTVSKYREQLNIPTAHLRMAW